LTVIVMVDVADDLVPMAELARRCGVSRQAVAKRVAKLVAAGRLHVERRGRVVLVDPEEYAAAVAADGDPARDELVTGTAPGTATGGEAGAAPGTYRDARTERERVELALKRLELERRRGELRPVADIEAAALEAGTAIARRLDHLPTLADELTSIAHRRGADGVRERLIGLARELREGVADELAAMAGDPSGAEAA
jgi:DNA-binding Lrp family transcriptional regulator